MLLSASGTYLLVALVAAAISYVLAQRKGLNAVGWAWASLFLIVPAAILPFVRSRRDLPFQAGIPDANWHALLAYDPEIKAAATQLTPFGAPARDDLRRAWEAVPNKGVLSAMVTNIEARWAAYATAGLVYVEARHGVAVLQDATGRYYVGERQTADLATARLMASVAANRAPTNSLVGAVVGAAVLIAGMSNADPVRAQAGTVAMTPPSCETYQRERPRGGPFEQLSDLFGLSIYRWDEADYGRLRSVMLDCKRSRPGFREDVTLRDWEAITEKTVADLKTYTGYVNRFGEPMTNRLGPRPAPGAPDYTRAFTTLSCDRFGQQGLNAWVRGGAPDYGPEAPFAVPVAHWTYEVWRAFENRVLNCGQQSGSPVEADRDWMRTLVGQQEVENERAIRQAQQDAAARATKIAGILVRFAEADTLGSADEIAKKLAAIEALAAAEPKLGRTELAQVTTARDALIAKLRNARMAEAEAWERDRPAREARAKQQDSELESLQRQNREREAAQGQELHRLQRLNQEREAAAAAERERVARIEAERQAPAHALAERQAREADEARQRVEEAAAKQRQRREQAEMAADPCNQLQNRRRLMDAANAMDRARYNGNKLLDLTYGHTLPEDTASTRSCGFIADWSSGRRSFVTITERKNSFGENLIELRSQ